MELVYSIEAVTASDGQIVAAGDVWQPKRVTFGYRAFTVLGIAEAKTECECWYEVQVARPYVYASSTGTTAPVPLMGCEVYAITAESLVKNYDRVQNNMTVP